MNVTEQIAQMVDKARQAQKVFEGFTQQQVDAAVRAAGKAGYDNAAPLARMAVDETGMGVYEDKVVKNASKSKVTWYRLKDVKSRGIIARDEKKGIVKVAKPIGVVGAVTPTTNPVITPIHNAMIALKGGNAILICPHPRAKKCGAEAVKLMRKAIAAVGAPEDLIQIVEEPTMEASAAVMALTDVCISTGGPGMVKAAYSSGKPAYGVGPGNVQCLVDRDVDIPAAVGMLTTGRTYDNGILCTCEQSVFVPADKFDEILAAFKANGAHYISDAKERDALRATVFPGGTIAANLVGASPVAIARAAGITVPEDTRLLLVETEKTGHDELLAKEKLLPVMCLYRYDNWTDAVEAAHANVEMEGTGHSMVIHSNTQAHVEQAANRINVSRFAVNQVGSSTLGGSMTNGLNPTATLGCGSWGNNIISENLWYYHLINVTRISYPLTNLDLPSDEEIWG